MFGPEAPPLEWDTDHAYTRGAQKKNQGHAGLAAGVASAHQAFQHLNVVFLAVSLHAIACRLGRAFPCCVQKGCTALPFLIERDGETPPQTKLCFYLLPSHTLADRVKVYYLSRAGKPLKQGALVEVLRHGQWPKDFDDAAPKQ